MTNHSLKRGENYYELLKVEKGATIAEIVTAYHAAKNAFSKDSVATYSLFNPEEAQAELASLERAYLTLSNLEKRAEYDKRLNQNSGSHSENDHVMTDIPPAVSGRPSAGESSSPDAAGAPSSAAPPTVPGVMNGAALREIREKRGLSRDDVARITKIPSRAIKSLEEEDHKTMPVRVYIQGFVKNLATLYKLDPVVTAKGYTAYLDSIKPIP